ncbi:fibrinogen-like protein 1 [Bactrocera tryoni]|uniref:fibrinogen-like protein 1 n=1 Tax=Bactrocera tryoni TaxID=59916 RepID=UPI001A98B320|nr:fibrinogen-like protein 1 [Bactrocera tryoni]
MFIIRALILVSVLFAFETNEFVQGRWWLSYLPPSHLKFYEAAMKLSLNNTSTAVNANSATIKPAVAATTSVSTVPANISELAMAAALSASVPNIATTLRPSEDQPIADSLNNLAALTSSTGNYYIFNYFFSKNDTVEANAENAPVDKEYTNEKVDNNVQYSIQPDCDNVSTSGAYLVRVALYSHRPFMVYCQVMDDDDHGWLVIQQRDFDDPPIDFNRTWADYRAGFGVIDGSYWLGLEKIWAITHSMLHELAILLLDFDNNFRWYRYDAFSIADEEQNYTLNLLGQNGGSAGNSLEESKGQKFSTYDRDNEGKCAEKMQAGWWYKDCEVGNLNSPFSKQMTANYEGVMWPTLYRDKPLSTVKMMVRARKYNGN